MVKKYLALLAIAGLVYAVQPPAASAQLNLELAQLNLQLGPLNLQLGRGQQQGNLVCLSDADARAATQAGTVRPLAQIIQGLAGLGQVISQQFCTLSGRFVWVISERNGGVVNQRVIDAQTGLPVGQ
jgi:hypothetical protein